MNQETEQQRVERLAKSAHAVNRDGDDPSWKFLREYERAYWKRVVQAIAASDREANWPFDPETHVVVPRIAWEGLVGWVRCGYPLSIEVQNAVVTASEEGQK